MNWIEKLTDEPGIVSFSAACSPIWNFIYVMSDDRPFRAQIATWQSPTVFSS